MKIDCLFGWNLKQKVHLAAPKRSRRPLVIILFRNATSTYKYNCWERETERWSTTCIKWLLMLRFVVTSIRTAQVTAGSSLSSRLVVQKEKNFLKSHHPKGAVLHDAQHTSHPSVFPKITQVNLRKFTSQKLRANVGFTSVFSWCNSHRGRESSAKKKKTDNQEKQNIKSQE